MRGCRSPRGFARHMREVHGLSISEYEILLIERQADLAAKQRSKACERNGA